MQYNRSNKQFALIGKRRDENDLEIFRLDQIIQQQSTGCQMFRSRINSTHAELMQSLRKQGVIKSQTVFDILSKIDRKFFVPNTPYYNDSPSSIGYGATISAPHMHAYALQYLQKEIMSAKNILDVGSGTGILTLALALMSPKDCKVYGIEHVPQLVKSSIQNIKNCDPKTFEEKIKIIQGDGRKGWPDKSIKFDVIHVGAAPAELPQGLTDQLAQGGVMVIPVGKQHQTQKFLRVEKKNGQIKQQNLHYVSYVPLTDLNKQIGKEIF